MMRIRKNAKDLSNNEKKDFIAALKALKVKQVRAPDGSQISVHDQFVAIHLGVTRKFKHGTMMPFGGHNGGHGNAAFLAWHREYLRRIEIALQDISGKPDLSIPYWDWTDRDTTMKKVFVDAFLGGNGTGPDVTNAFGFFGKTVVNGPFSKANGWPIDPRVHRWRLTNPLQFGDELIRNLSDPADLPSQAQVEDLFATDKNVYEAFRRALEAGTQMHNFMHGWVGGTMVMHSSPNDPIFMLNHSNIDRIWALWQSDGHQGDSHYPYTGEPEGHNLEDSMWPWDGGGTGVTTTPDIQDLIPGYSEDVWPAHVLDCKTLDYAYVTWDRVKVLLDAAVERWRDRMGFMPDLTIHGDNFGWNSRQQLASATAFGLRLIEPNKVGNNRGHETNLVKALKHGAPGFPPMPLGGPPVPKSEVAEIAHWVDMGMPG